MIFRRLAVGVLCLLLPKQVDALVAPAVVVSSRPLSSRQHDTSSAKAIVRQTSASSASTTSYSPPPPPPAQSTHADITWKLCPPPETPLLQKLQWSLSGTLLRLQHQWQGREPPKLLFPLGGQAVLEAYVTADSNKKVGRFGILTKAGPSTVELEQAVRRIYHMDNNNVTPTLVVRAAAIIYMFVEPDFRGRGLGRLALEAIAYLHAARGCDYTVLVADDKTVAAQNSDDDDENQMKLVRWYERNGYTRAPELQDVLGSPDGVYGITMIAPTRPSIPQDCVIQWW